MIRKFPENFLWGSATSSHQVEGGNTNDWSEWEKENAIRLAREADEKFGNLPNWKEKFGKEASSTENYRSDIACDHYHRYEEDFDIAKSLGHTAHRFSLEWSRVEPEENQWNYQEIKHYQDILHSLRSRNIEPFVTLWHWTLPLWLSDKRGILATDFPKYFERYAKKMSEALGNDVSFWITLNEPDVVSSHAYLKGAWPPQQKNFFKFLMVNFALVKAHLKAYKVIKKQFPNAKVGIAKHQVSFELGRNTLFNRLLRKSAHYFWNRWFLDRIKNAQDFIGLNHYNRNVINNGFNKNPNKKLTDFGWEFCPESIYQALMELTPYKKPIYITENGIADRDDTLRKEFLTRAISTIHQAIQDGAPVRGYLYWSLLDNFEWDKGFWPCFGLVEIDRKTLERKIRPSAEQYAKICKTNALETND